MTDDLGFMPLNQGNTMDDLGFVATPQAGKSQSGGFLPKSAVAGLNAFNAGAERLPHGILQLFTESGFAPERLKNASRKVAQEREADYAQAAKEYPHMAPLLSTAGSLVSSSPLMAIPGAGQTATARAVTQGAAQGGAMGFGQYTPENSLIDRFKNAGIGAGAGTAFPLLTRGAFASNPFISIPTTTALGAGTGAAGAAMLGLDPLAGGIAGGTIGAGIGSGKSIHNYLRPQGAIMKEVLDTVDDIPGMINRKQVADKNNLHITPAEASGSSLLGAGEGRVGRTAKGAKLWDAYANKRVDQEKAMVGGFLDDVSPNTDNAAMEIRDSAKSLFERKSAALQQKASPFYKQSAGDLIPDDQFTLLMQDPIIANAYKQVAKNPVFQKTLAGVKPNTIQYLDEVKKFINESGSAYAVKGKRYSAGVTQGSARAITDVADKISPVYGKARSVFGEGAKPLEKLKNSMIGRFADTPDYNVENIPGQLFNPNKTSPKTFTRLTNELYRQNPEAYQTGIRNHLDDLLNKTQRTGISLSNKVFKDDKKYNLMYSAVRFIDGAQEKMADLKYITEHLINPKRTPRGEAALSATGMKDTSIWRNFDIKRFADDLLGGNYDRAKIEFITNPKWDSLLQDYMKRPTKNFMEKAIKYQGILSKIATSIGTSPDNEEQ